MTSPQHPETGLAPGLGQPPRVKFLTARVNPLRTAQTPGPNPGLQPSTPRDQPESRTVSPVNPTRDNPLPNPRTDSPATATAPNPPGPNAQETHHDSLADPPTDTVTAPLSGRPPKPCSHPRQSRPAAYDHSPAAGPGRTPRCAQRGRSQQTKNTGRQVWARTIAGRPAPVEQWITSAPMAHQPVVELRTFLLAQSSVSQESEHQQEKRPHVR